MCVWKGDGASSGTLSMWSRSYCSAGGLSRVLVRSRCSLRSVVSPASLSSFTIEEGFLGNLWKYQLTTRSLWHALFSLSTGGRSYTFSGMGMSLALMFSSALSIPLYNGPQGSRLASHCPVFVLNRLVPEFLGLLEFASYVVEGFLDGW